MITKEIENIRDLIIQEYHPDKIILFGSFAKGTEHDDSDIDILVISDHEKDLPRTKRGFNLRLKLAVMKKPIDIIFYSQEDLDRWKNIRQSFCATLLREGITIYG
jgi:predicted nucleotidyltransferase